jgi:hypothetical protein
MNDLKTYRESIFATCARRSNGSGGSFSSNEVFGVVACR